MSACAVASFCFQCVQCVPQDVMSHGAMPRWQVEKLIQINVFACQCIQSKRRPLDRLSWWLSSCCRLQVWSIYLRNEDQYPKKVEMLSCQRAWCRVGGPWTTFAIRESFALLTNMIEQCLSDKLPSSRFVHRDPWGPPESIFGVEKL